MVGVNFSRVKLSVEEKYWLPPKNWSLSTGGFFTEKVLDLLTQKNKENKISKLLTINNKEK